MKNILIALLFISGSAAAQRTGFYPVRAPQSFGKVELRDSVILTALTASKIMKLDANKNITTATDGTDYWSPSSISLAFGVYLATATNITNTSVLTIDSCQYLRVGNVVTVSGSIQVTPISGATVTQWYISLPFASDFTAGRQCEGVFSGNLESGAIVGATTENAAAFTFVPATNSGAPYSFTFTYRIL